jgi:hypothetical protein
MTDGAAVGAALARQPVPLELIDSTVNASLAFASAQSTAAGVASATATALARGVLHTMMISKLKFFGAAALATALALGGVQTLARQQAGRGPAGQPARGTTLQPAAASPDQGDRRDALLRSVDRIDEVLDDLDRRNHELQKELRALRKEIGALRTGQPEKPKAADDSGPSIVARPGGAIGRLTTREKPDERPTITSRADAPPLSAAIDRDAELPGHRENGRYILVTSPQGDRAAMYDRTTLETKTVRFPVPKGSRHILTTLWTEGIIALQVKGPSVSRIAVYLITPGGDAEGWYSQDLREPVDEARVRGGRHRVFYCLGRYVYAFSAWAKRWGVLELPPGSQPNVVEQIGSVNVLTVSNGSHLYEFRVVSGTWHDIDFNAILETPPGEKSKDVKVPGS